MQVKHLDVTVSVLFLVFGIWVAFQGVEYGVTSDRGPGSGTFPLIAGVLIVVFAFLGLVRDLLKGMADNGGITLKDLAKIAGIIFLIWLYIMLFDSLGAFLPLPFLIIGISLMVHLRLDPPWLLSITGLAIALTVTCYYIFAVG